MQSEKISTSKFVSEFSDEEINNFRNETAGTANVIHLNNAGAGLMPDVVTQAVIDYIKLESSIGGYEASALKSQEIRDFYFQAAKLLNCQDHNIAFTASATDSYTRALSSIPFKSGDVILTDNDDFISNQIQFLSLKKRLGIKLVRINNVPEGGIDLKDLEQKLISIHPRLLAITHIPTNAGLIQPVKEIAEIFDNYVNSRNEKIWYILDACQSIGQMKLDVQELKCDFLSVTARKFLRGPRGTGFLYISDRALKDGLEPMFIDMRGAEWVEKDSYVQKPDATRFEDWEFAYALILGTRQAILYFLRIGEDRVRRQVTALAELLRSELNSIDKIRVLDKGAELGGLVTFTIEGSQPGFIIHKLLERKINTVPSFRNFAVIDFDEKKVEWAIRVSPHYYNTLEEIQTFINTIRHIAIQNPD